MTQQELTQSVRAALEADVRINLARHPLRIEAMRDGAVVLEGEVPDVAARKWASTWMVWLQDFLNAFTFFV